MEFITIGIRATCRWQFGTAFKARARRQHCESYDRVWPEYFLGRSSSNRIGNGSASAGDADDESKADDDDDDGHADDGSGSVSDF